MYTIFVEQGPIAIAGTTYTPPAGLMNIHSEYANAADAWATLNALIHAHVPCTLTSPDGVALDSFSARGTR